MSDESNEPTGDDDLSPESAAAFFIPASLREMQEQMNEARDRQAMESQAASHAVQQFLDSLGVDQMTTLKAIFEAMATSERADMTAAYYEGICASYLHVKFDVCPGCGVDHAQELLDTPVEDEGES